MTNSDCRIVSGYAHSRSTGRTARCPLYRQTPLLRLEDVAAEAGVAEVLYKDEGGRLGLGSFKALGGAWAVSWALRDAVSARSGTAPDLADLAGRSLAEITRTLTVTCVRQYRRIRNRAWAATAMASYRQS